MNTDFEIPGARKLRAGKYPLLEVPELSACDMCVDRESVDREDPRQCQNLPDCNGLVFIRDNRQTREEYLIRYVQLRMENAE